jgi:predicted SAM-dependent methyltransferase
MRLPKTFYKILTRLPILPRRYHCEICDKPVFAFIPLSKFYREQAKKYGFPYQPADFETIDPDHFYCPRCFSFDRERLFMFYLKRHHRFNPGDKLMEFAPSPGFARVVEKTFNVVYKTCDLFMPGVDFKLDIQDLGVLESESYDFIICSHVLEHIPDDFRSMQNMYRILRKGGKAIMMVPVLKHTDAIDEDPECTDIAERWRRFGQDDHIRLYSRKVFVERLSRAGFRVEILNGKDYPREELLKFGIPVEFVLYIASRT